MDRRKFLETVVVSAATSPLLGRPPAPQQPTASRDTNPRVRQNFNAGWLFQRQSKGAGELGSFDRRNGEAAEVEPRFREAFKAQYDDSGWQPIELPHTWNAHDATDAKPGYWRGIGWYRKHFKLDGGFSGKRVFLEFEGVNSVSEFWLNVERIGEHKGGYTSFEFDVTRRVRFGAEDNVLTVKVDNLYHATVPPTVKTDYTFYGGIYRDAWLRLCEPTYVAEVIWTTPAVSQQSAEVQLESRIVNKTSQTRELTVVHEILDPHHRSIKTISSPVRVTPGGTAAITQRTGSLDNPLLWAPDSPNLYRIKTSLREGEILVDLVENPLGFRSFKFDPQQGFLLNGTRVQIQGTNWHQCYPGMGNALPNSRHVKDMELIRGMGANFWRTSHYPHDPATIEASDRLGLMVWEELPINKEIGNPDEYIANVLNMAEEMIRRDRNNPSVTVWGIAGEINAPERVSRRLVEAVATKYRQLDPTRPVAMHEPRGDEIETLVDVVGLGASAETDEKHRRHPRRRYMVSEYAVATMGRGIYGMGPESEDLACVKHEEYLRRLYARPWMAGGLIWHQFDYEGENYDTVIPHVVAFGMTDVWRVPKDVYSFYQSQWSATPLVHIVGHWTWPGDEGKTKSVKVYSNLEEVELFLNGASLGAIRDSKDSGLPHPPRTWRVPFQPGTLTAVARSRSVKISDERRTAGPPHHIALESDAPQLRGGDRESLAYITARVVDEQQTVVPTAYHPITFTAYGPGELLPQTWLGQGTGLTWNAIAGQTRIAFRADDRTGHSIISAYSPGLGMGRIKLEVARPGQPDEMEYQERFDDDEP
ncbi:MAG TPA: glycoside hydrolase family 2 TIM barrel-domain containing protein [Terriglobia bacterium]|nr:glycoside hydrolase family 2 TIM barrel-domain containing protein [Terriglobia bacterium]